MTPDRPMQTGAGMQLRAHLAPENAAGAAVPPQEGGRFALIARAAAPALVCYNDTIFRDDFDGDGR